MDLELRASGELEGINLFFYNLILFYRVLTKLQDGFYILLKLEFFLRYSRSKSEASIRSLWEGQTITSNCKKDYFTKNLSPPTFFEIITSSFQEIFPEIC